MRALSSRLRIVLFRFLRSTPIATLFVDLFFLNAILPHTVEKHVFLGGYNHTIAPSWLVLHALVFWGVLVSFCLCSLFAPSKYVFGAVQTRCRRVLRTHVHRSTDVFTWGSFATPTCHANLGCLTKPHRRWSRSLCLSFAPVGRCCSWKEALNNSGRQWPTRGPGVYHVRCRAIAGRVWAWQCTPTGCR